MKKLVYSILTIVALSVAFASCQMMEKDLFEKDPATRQDNWMAEYRRVFNNNQYGWALYTSFPTYGRHPSVNTFAARFEQEYCTFYQSAATVRIPGAYDKDSVTSTYAFKMDNGIVLSFDTYNLFFHYYSDQSQYFAQDMQGDFEFCLDRFSENEDTIFGHGKTKGLPFFMVKMKTTPKEYQKLADEVDQYSAYDCLFICEGDSLPRRFLTGYHNLAIYFPDEDGGENVEHLYSYGTLVNGIYMMENIVYKNTRVVELTLDRTTGTYEDLVGKSGSKIVGTPLADYFLNIADYENWFFGYSGLGSYTKSEWDKVWAAMEASGKFKADYLYNITLDCDGNGGISLVLNMWYGVDEVRFPLEVKRGADDQIALKGTGEQKHGRDWDYYDIGLKYIVDALAKKDSWTTYKVSFREGNPMTPKGFELTDVNNPDNSIYFETYYRYYHSTIWE